MDLLFVGCILACLYFGLGHRAVILFALIVPFAFAWDSLSKLSKADWVLIFLLAQYALIHVAKLTVIDDPYPLEMDHPPSELQHWIVGLLLSVLVPIRLSRIENIDRILSVLLPLVLGLVFVVMAWHYYTPEKPVCRIKNEFMPVFTAPMIFAFLTSLMFFNISKKSKFYRSTTLVFVACSILIATAFASTRGIFLAQLVTFGGVGGLMILSRSHRVFGLSLWGAIVLTLGALIVLPGLDRCGAFDRLSNVNKAISSVQEEQSTGATSIADDDLANPDLPQSVGERMLIYEHAIERVKSNPIFGSGIQSEQSAVPQNYRKYHIHVHSMYLSWLIWGGVISLGSGLLFLASAGLASPRKWTMNHCVLIAATLGIFAVPLAVDSFLVWRHYYYIYILMISLAFYLLKSLEASKS